ITFGAPMEVNILLNGSQLTDTLSLNGNLFVGDTSSVVIAHGTFVTNSDSIKAGVFTAASTNAKKILLEDSEIELIFGLNFLALTNLDAGTSHIFLSGSIVPDFFYGNDLDFYDVTLQSLSSDTSTSLTGSNTYNNLTFNAGLNVDVEDGSLQTVNGLFLANGNCQDSIFVQSQSNGVQADFDLANPGNASCINVQDIDVATSTLTAFFSINYGNNTCSWTIDTSKTRPADYNNTYHYSICALYIST